MIIKINSLVVRKIKNLDVSGSPVNLKKLKKSVFCSPNCFDSM